MLCNICKHPNPVDANFCSECGALLVTSIDDTTVSFHPVEVEEAEQDVSLTLGDLAAGTGVLIVKRGPNAGSKFLLKDDVTRAGRHPDSDIFLDDVTVSRRHAEFIRQGQDKGYTIRYVGSLNGTYLNRERIEEATLTSGDEIQIGKFKLTYLAGTAQK